MAKPRKGVSFAKNQLGDVVLAPIKGKYKSRFIIHPLYQKELHEPKKRKKRWWRGLDPWQIAIKGHENVKLFRNCDDVVKYDIKRIIELLYQTNVIKSTRPCPRSECNGTLRIHYKGALGNKTDWASNGGYIYICDGGDGENGCGRGRKAHKGWRSILTGTVLFNKIPPDDFIRLLFAYAVISHAV